LAELCFGDSGQFGKRMADTIMGKKPKAKIWRKKWKFHFSIKKIEIWALTNDEGPKSICGQENANESCQQNANGDEKPLRNTIGL
jgi:hypothetical protein